MTNYYISIGFSKSIWFFPINSATAIRSMCGGGVVWWCCFGSEIFLCWHQYYSIIQLFCLSMCSVHVVCAGQYRIGPFGIWPNHVVANWTVAQDLKLTLVNKIDWTENHCFIEQLYNRIAKECPNIRPDKFNALHQVMRQSEDVFSRSIWTLLSLFSAHQFN